MSRPPPAESSTAAQDADQPVQSSVWNPANPYEPWSPPPSMVAPGHAGTHGHSIPVYDFQGFSTPQPSNGSTPAQQFAAENLQHSPYQTMYGDQRNLQANYDGFQRGTGLHPHTPPQQPMFSTHPQFSAEHFQYPTHQNGQFQQGYYPSPHFQIQPNFQPQFNSPTNVAQPHLQKQTTYLFLTAQAGMAGRSVG